MHNSVESLDLFLESLLLVVVLVVDVVVLVVDVEVVVTLVVLVTVEADRRRKLQSLKTNQSFLLEMVDGFFVFVIIAIAMMATRIPKNISRKDTKNKNGHNFKPQYSLCHFLDCGSFGYIFFCCCAVFGDDVSNG